ncbi:MAG: DUF177 domain-containing protein [Devosia sp.]|uniref:YceD family protein n=1 Tax=Devosia sp. TaxID=1871048 RepID=UPI0024C5DB2B|nr:DUF177 domain-containing protein [Devosia sp.]UYN99965.1 MAG: DUF177 domain-containing protein [Devosia sp.]
MSEKNAPLFDAVVRIDKLPASGRSVSIDADAATRAAIAEAMNILSVEQFVAKLTVVPLRGGLRAQGRLEARVTQASVVTQSPVSQTVSEEIDRVFLPAGRDKPAAPGSEIYVDLEDDDFPDHIEGPEVDLSALVLETLALALDPYPRLEGESLTDLDLKPEGPEGGAFAKLAALKRDDGEKS